MSRHYALFYTLALLIVANFTSASALAEIKTGDVLIQSIPCYVCSLIEIEEQSPYSHAGVAIVQDESISVLESWTQVRKVSLSDFLKVRKRAT
jgi:hypothetical protein